MTRKDILPVIGWFWRDWRASSARAMLSPLSRGIYRELLDAHYGEDSCSLPDDDHKLAALAGVSVKVWLSVKEEVLPWLPLTADGRRQNPRALQGWMEAQGHREAKRKAGKKGADRKWHSHGGAIDLPLTKNSPHTSLLTPLSLHTPPTPSGEGVCDGYASDPKQNPNPEPESNPGGNSVRPDPDLLEAWNRERAKRRLPANTLTATHKRAFEQLWHATGKIDEATAAIAEFVATPDDFLAKAGWSVKVFPHRIDACVMRAREAIDRRRKRRVVAPHDESDVPVASPEVAKARLAEMRSRAVKVEAKEASP